MGSRKASSLAYWYDVQNKCVNIYIGTYKGEIVWFKLSTPQGSSCPDVGLAREVASVLISPKRKRVRQLEAVSGIQRIIALCEDGCITVRNLLTLDPVESKSLSKHQSANLFVQNKSGPPLFPLCVAEKKKLSLYEYARGQYRFLKELPITQTPLDMEWLGDSICLGFRKEYSIITVSTGQSVEVPGLLDADTPPRMKLVPNEQLLVVGAPSLGMFLHFNATPVTRNPIQWPTLPVSFGYCGRHLLTLYRDHIAVYKFDNGDGQMPQLIQEMPIIGTGSVLVDGGFRASHMNSSSGGGCSQTDGFAFIVASRSLSFIQSVPTDIQVQTLLDLDPPQVAQARNVLENEREQMEKNKQFDKLSIWNTRISKFAAKAAHVLFSALQFDEAAKHWEEAIAGDISEDPRNLIALFPDIQPPGFSFQREKNLSSISIGNSVINDGGARACLARVLISHKNSETCRRQLRQRGGNEALTCVDSSLLKVLVLLVHESSNPPSTQWQNELQHLVVSNNYCDLILVEKILRQFGLEHFLALFYSTRGMKQKACSVWAQLCDSPEGAGWGGWLEGTSAVKAMSNYFCSKNVDPESNGEDANLIFQFTAPLLSKYPQEILSVFMSPSTSGLNPMRVIKHLEGQLDGQLLRKYLENKLSVQGMSDIELGTRLALEYATHVISLLDDNSPEVVEIRDKLYSFLQNGEYDIDKVLLYTKDTNLHNENVELYRRQNKHSEALDILVCRLNNIDEAEKYCICCGTSSNEAFIILLGMLFNTQDENSSIYREKALYILKNNTINPTAVLRVIPDDVKLVELMEYFQRTMPQRFHDLRQAQVRKHLMKYDAQISVLAELHSLESRKIVIDRESTCCVSGEPIDENMVFAVFPNGRVALHHHVQGEKLYIDPYTGQRFDTAMQLGGDSTRIWLPGTSGCNRQ